MMRLHPLLASAVEKIPDFEIERQQGLQFDPDIVTAFLQLRDKVVEVMQRFEKKRRDQT